MGGICYMPKSDADQELIEAVKAAARGETFGTLL
jgi:hypothetical protein